MVVQILVKYKKYKNTINYFGDIYINVHKVLKSHKSKMGVIHLQ